MPSNAYITVMGSFGDPHDGVHYGVGDWVGYSDHELLPSSLPSAVKSAPVFAANFCLLRSKKYASGEANLITALDARIASCCISFYGQTSAHYSVAGISYLVYRRPWLFIYKA